MNHISDSGNPMFFNNEHTKFRFLISRFPNMCLLLLIYQNLISMFSNKEQPMFQFPIPQFLKLYLYINNNLCLLSSSFTCFR